MTKPKSRNLIAAQFHHIVGRYPIENFTSLGEGVCLAPGVATFGVGGHRAYVEERL
jgi:hypothetical protein